MRHVSHVNPAEQAGLDSGRATAFIVGLIDDATALFPAGSPIADAIREHRAHRAYERGLIVGPFLAPVSRLGEVLDSLDTDPSSDPLDLVLIADTGLVEAAEAKVILLDDDRAELLGLEIALAADGPLGDSAQLTLGSLDFALSAAVDSSASNVVVGNSSAAGDGSAALALSNLQNTQLAGLGNQTFGGYYNTLVSTIGRDTNVAQNNVDTANGLSEQVDSQVQSTSGVNIDDEMSNMLKFQRSYQAAAKVLNTMDQVTSDLINMITH